jgi:NADH-quinone oxidoreductase subunit C
MKAMNNSEINNVFALERLRTEFAEKILTSDEPFGLLTIEVAASDAHEIIQWLKEDAVLRVDFLTNIGGVHYPEAENREFAVVYHLHSLVHNFRIRIKAFVPLSNPSILSLTDIYSGSNWMERETFDFYGIQFINHPNLIRILNEEDMDYHPMRKEYQLEDATRLDKDNRFFGR